MKLLSPVAPRRLLTAALLASSVLASSVLGGAPALAQGSDINSLINRLNRLENEVNTLNRQVYRGGVPAPAGPAGAAAGGGLPPSLAADFEVRLTRLEREIQNLTGRYEEAAFGVAQIRERLDKMQTDIDYRLTEIESKLSEGAAAPSGNAAPPAASASAAPAAPPVASSAPPAVTAAPATGNLTTGSLPTGNAQEDYDRAFGLLRNADYAQAETALSGFLQKYPDHVLAPNAQYWLAETYYVRQKYREAAIAFAEGYQNNPKGSKAADNLLKLGMSLAALNNKDDACVTFDQLAAEFPDASATIKRRAEQERTRLGCP